MNLTLSVDDQIVARARRVAESMGKSVNQLVREYLESLTEAGDAERDIDELRLLSQRGKGRSRGWKFSRDEIHDRS